MDCQVCVPEDYAASRPHKAISRTSQKLGKQSQLSITQNLCRTFSKWFRKYVCLLLCLLYKICLIEAIVNSSTQIRNETRRNPSRANRRVKPKKLAFYISRPGTRKADILAIPDSSILSWIGTSGASSMGWMSFVLYNWPDCVFIVTVQWLNVLSIILGGDSSPGIFFTIAFSAFYPPSESPSPSRLWAIFYTWTRPIIYLLCA